MKHAFRCKNCGRFHTSDDAAEASHPHACKVCGAGVSFNRQGIKTLDGDNWEVLASSTPERLTELGLSKEDTEGHKMWSKPESKQRDPVHLNVAADDGSGTKDGA